MKTLQNKKQIKAEILGLGLYPSDRRRVTALIEQITGANLKDERVYKIGEKFTLGSNPVLLACVGAWQIGLVNTDTGCHYGENATVNKWRDIPQSTIDKMLETEFHKELIPV